jgi:hypothetical protein
MNDETKIQAEGKHKGRNAKQEAPHAYTNDFSLSPSGENGVTEWELIRSCFLSACFFVSSAILLDVVSRVYST